MGPRAVSLLVASALAAALAGGTHAADRRAAGSLVLPVAAAGNEAVLELLNDIEELKAEVRQLRGQLEVQDHELEQIKSGQRKSLIDIDRRLRELERHPAGTAAGSASGEARANVAAPIPAGTVGTPPPSVPTMRSVPSAPEQRQYDAAFALMKQGLYQKAAAQFRDFIARNPKSALADNAQYWIGEAAYVTRDFRTALEEFGKVVTNYPQSPKVPDALLKIGYSHYELAAYDRAREVLNQVITRFPNTAVAKSAQLRLDKMARENH